MDRWACTLVLNSAEVWTRKHDQIGKDRLIWSPPYHVSELYQHLKDYLYRYIERNNLKKLTSLDFGYGGVLILKGQWRSRFVRLASCTIHCHYPQMTLVFVVTGIYDTISFFNRIKKVSTTFQVCKEFFEYVY